MCVRAHVYKCLPESMLLTFKFVFVYAQTWNWIGYDSWQHSEWCPLCPSSSSTTRLLWTHVCGFFYGITPSYIYFVFLFSGCLSLSPALLWLPKSPAFSWCARSRTASVWSLLPPVMCLAYFTLGPTCLSSWQSRVSADLSSSSIVKWINVSISLFHCPAFTSGHSNWEYQGVDDLRDLGL